MQLGLIGLGKMGGYMVKRLANDGHNIIVFDQKNSLAEEIANSRAKISAIISLQEFTTELSSPRIIWVMVPSGNPIKQVIESLSSILDPNDIIIDGGNSNYKESIKRAKYLNSKGIQFVDVGTSGGVWGLTEGYSMMIGGEETTIEYLKPIFQSLAPAKDKGWGRVGLNGAGHFVKMIHNGIEYGIMQAMAEGFDILHSKKDFKLDLHQISEIWRYGSVIRSWLLDLTSQALKGNKNLDDIKAWVADSGEGRWTVFESIDLDVPAPIISLALMMRFISRQEDSFSAKLLAAMRNQFGGHNLPKKD